MSNSSVSSSLTAGAEAAHDLLSAYSYQCSCSGCAGGTGGGMSALAFATTPGEASYQYASTTPIQYANAGVNALLAGSKWSGVDGATAKTVITYSFVNPSTSVLNAGYGSSVHEFSASDKAVTRELLDRIEAVCNVQFVEVPDDASVCGVVRYAYSAQPNAMGYAGYAYFPSAQAVGGDVLIGNNQAGAQWDFYRPNLILHETLHAIGLKHPFEGPSTLANADNIIPNTVMSYSAIAGSSSGSLSSYPSEPMPLDTAALQQLYGAATHEEGDTVYDLASGFYQDGFHAIWDSGGKDTLDASRVAGAVTLDLVQGGHSNVGVTVFAFSYNANGSRSSTTYSDTIAISRDSVIENATGSAFDDRITGNESNNTLRGGEGNDTLTGGGGNDILDGGAGLDTLALAGPRAGYTVRVEDGHFVVSGTGAAGGRATLTDVERVAFADRGLALDLDGNAGAASKLLGAVGGKGAAHNAAFVGIVMGLLDGGTSRQDVAGALVEAVLGHASNENLVQLLVGNVLGFAPGAAQTAALAGLISAGVFTQGSFTAAVSQLELNAQNIGLAGMAQTGIEYVPFG
ncbi:MAG: M10 family metallopeptidase C-terminal domain-containing protein [Burkholderiales bacterium]|nr:M10 family metallopeptidase C-terminal domain-containing protein [Burkholderiales bacterium]